VQKETERLAFSMAEAADALGVSLDIIKRGCAQNLIKSTKLGGLLRRIPASEVRRLAEQGLPPIKYPARISKPPGSRRGRPRKAKGEVEAAARRASP
jgi:excisionase family DNA binding protein